MFLQHDVLSFTERQAVAMQIDEVIRSGVGTKAQTGAHGTQNINKAHGNAMHRMASRAANIPSPGRR